LGANTPANCVLRTIEKRNLDLLYVLATTTFNSQTASDLIRQVRASDAGAGASWMGGMVLLAAGDMAYRAVKLSQKDAKPIEEHAGESVEQLTDEELRESEGE
jgi:hypothetical protein